MASPQPTGQPTATTTAAPPRRAAPMRTGAIFGIVGGALAIVGFFLPWTVQVNPNVANPGPASFSTVSGWDIASKLFTGTSSIVPGQTTPPLYSPALLIAAPALLAVVVLVVCAISLWRQPSPVLTGLFGSAAVLGALSTFGSYSASALNITAISLATADTGGDLAYVSTWVGIGSVVIYLGYLGILAGGVMMVLSTRQSAS